MTSNKQKLPILILFVGIACRGGKSIGTWEPTIFARNYGTAAVISYNLKGIAPPVPPVQCWANKNLTSGCAAPTLKRVGGGRVENMYQEMVYYN
jgi:hypothetical protein